MALFGRPTMAIPGVMPRRGGGIDITIDTASMKRVMDNMDAMSKKAIKEAKRGVSDEAKAVLERAKEYCPVDTGRLRDSGRKLPPNGVRTSADKTEFTTEIVFGGKPVRGKNVDYALHVHEGFYHVRAGKQIKGRKFLERAMREVGRGMARRIASRIHI